MYAYIRLYLLSWCWLWVPRRLSDTAVQTKSLVAVDACLSPIIIYSSLAILAGNTWKTPYCEWAEANFPMWWPRSLQQRLFDPHGLFDPHAQVVRQHFWDKVKQDFFHDSMVPRNFVQNPGSKYRKMLGWQWLGRLWQCRSLSGRCESLPCHCHFAAFRHLPSNLITHLVLSPSCQKPDIIYVFALCKLLGLSQKRGTTMKKQLSHHIKLEGVQSKFKLKTKRQLANDFNMIGASWNMHGDNMNTEIAWKQQTPILPSPTFELCARKVKKYGKLVSPGRNLFCLLWPRTAWDLFYAGVQTTRICENEAINCEMGIHQLISQCTSCCSSDSESTHNANGCQ